MYVAPLLIEKPFSSIDPGEILYIKKYRYNVETGKLEQIEEKWTIESSKSIASDRMFELLIVSDNGSRDTITARRK